MILRPKPQKFTATIEKKEQLTAIILVTFKLESPHEIPFLAGQTFMLNVGNGVNRTMSIASPPSVKHSILMCHDVSPKDRGPNGRSLTMWVTWRHLWHHLECLTRKGKPSKKNSRGNRNRNGSVSIYAFGLSG